MIYESIKNSLLNKLREIEESTPKAINTTDNQPQNPFNLKILQGEDIDKLINHQIYWMRITIRSL